MTVIERAVELARIANDMLGCAEQLLAVAKVEDQAALESGDSRAENEAATWMLAATRAEIHARAIGRTISAAMQVAPACNAMRSIAGRPACNAARSEAGRPAGNATRSEAETPAPIAAETVPGAGKELGEFWQRAMRREGAHA